MMVVGELQDWDEATDVEVQVGTAEIHAAFIVVCPGYICS